MSEHVLQVDWLASSDPFSATREPWAEGGETIYGRIWEPYHVVRFSGRLHPPASRLPGPEMTLHDEGQEAVRIWSHLARRFAMPEPEKILVDFFTTQELAVIKAGMKGSAKTVADSSRLTHDSLRRISWSALLGIASTQFIYLVTGITILHPIAAILCSAVAVSFYVMSRMMRNELEEILSSGGRAKA